MDDSRLNVAERRRQPSFSLRRLSRVGLIALAAVLPCDDPSEFPNREPAPDAIVPIRFTPLALASTARLGPLRVRCAWTVSASDPRFFGLSALAVDGAGFLAMSDSGVAIRLPRPGRPGFARLHDLPAGPGFATFKKYRDSEGLLRTAGGWFVTFEYRDSLWFFDPDFARGRRVTDLTPMHWPRNEGIEALVRAPGGGLLLLPETRRGALLLRSGRATLLPLAGRNGGLADAVTLPDGRIVVAVRKLGLGITNQLAWLEPDGAGYRLRPFASLPLGWLDNVEGLAAEPLPGGRTRLWAITDNDGWRRTVLLELELPATTKAPAKAGAS